MADKAAQTVRDELGTCVPEEVRDYAADTAAGLSTTLLERTQIQLRQKCMTPLDLYWRA